MNVLVVAPHPDDESIGLGGTIRLHHRRGDRVSVAFLTSGELGLKHLEPEAAMALREAEARRAAESLAIADVRFLRLPDWGVADHLVRGVSELVRIIDSQAPGKIYTPHADEDHPDHAAACQMTLAAASEVSNFTPSVLAYEVWTPMSRFDHIEDISDVMPDKLRAVRAYRSQLEQFRYDRATEGLAAYRGELGAKVRYAEVFAWLR